MARINRRPSAVRRAAMPEEAPPQFNMPFELLDIGEGDMWGPPPMGGPMGAPDPTFDPDPMGGMAGTPPLMGSSSIPAGAAGIKTPTMTMPSGGGYFSGGSPGSLGPDPMTSGAPHVPSAEEEAAKWDIKLPSWHLSGLSPTSEGEWKEDSYTYRPEMAPWAKTMGMTPEMWTKGGEGLTPYDPRYISHGAGGPGSGSILPMSRSDPAYHAMGTPDPFYSVRPGGKERLAETGKFRDFSRGGEWRSPPRDARGRPKPYIGGRESDGKAWFMNPVTEFTPSWLEPGMTSWPGMPK